MYYYYRTMVVMWTLAIALLIVYLWRYLQGRKYKLPPGPRGIPYIGNVFQLDPERPHETITQWSQKYGDVLKIKIFGKTSVILNSYETISEALITRANQFAGRPNMYRMKAVVSHSPDMVSTTFTPRFMFTKKLTIQSLKMYGDGLERLETLSMELIADMLEVLREVCSKQTPTDIYPVYLQCITGIITSILWGEKKEGDKIAHILKCVEESIRLIQPSGPYVILDVLPILRYVPNKLQSELSRIAGVLKEILDSENNDRRSKMEVGQPTCLIDTLLEHQCKTTETDTQMRLTDEELYGVTINLFFAGVFSTSTTLNALIAVLVNKPHIQNKMAAEIQAKLGARKPSLKDRKSLHYVEAAILEVLRYSSILTLNVPHATMEDVNINGYDVPKGTEVLFNLWKLHHNEEYWDEPWEFKPERFMGGDGSLLPPEHINRKRLLPFGASRRVCVGEALAKNRLFLVVTSLLQHFQFKPASANEIPRHDPRDYKNSFGVEPHRYRVTILPRK